MSVKWIAVKSEKLGRATEIKIRFPFCNWWNCVSMPHARELHRKLGKVLDGAAKKGRKK